MALYDEIEKRCKLQGTSVAALERDLGFGKGSIGKLKNGNDVSSSRLSMIATTLGSTSSELLGEITPLPSRQYSPEVRKLADIAEKLPPESLRVLTDVALQLKRRSRPRLGTVVKTGGKIEKVQLRRHGYGVLH